MPASVIITSKTQPSPLLHWVRAAPAGRWGKPEVLFLVSGAYSPSLLGDTFFSYVAAQRWVSVTLATSGTLRALVPSPRAGFLGL